MPTFYEATQDKKTQVQEIGTGFFSYLLYTDGGKRTYVGATNDPDRRLRQHNGEISGGAFATKGRKWTRALHVGGFPDWQSTLQFEWAWKHYSRKQNAHGLRGKLEGLLHLLQLDKATSKAVPYCMWPHKLYIESGSAALPDLKKIETYNRVMSVVGLPQKVNPFLPLPSNTSFPSNMSSLSDITSLAVQVDLLSSEVKLLSERLTTALAKIDADSAAVKKRSKKADASSSDGEETAENTKTKTKTKTKTIKTKAVKAAKEKVACPTAEEGVIRFYSSAGTSPYKGFSNLAKAEFTLDGQTYFSVENYIQSEKFASTDPEYAEKIRNQKNPALVKGMGKSKGHAAAEDWETRRVDVMRRGLLAKFTSNEALKEVLLSTGDAKIEEESPADSFWGIGADGQGENWTGKLLMELRDSLHSLRSSSS